MKLMVIGVCIVVVAVALTILAPLGCTSRMRDGSSARTTTRFNPNTAIGCYCAIRRTCFSLSCRALPGLRQQAAVRKFLQAGTR